MTIGSEVTVTTGGMIIESVTTYSDKEKSCGYVRLSPRQERSGTIIGYKDGWFFSYWIVALDNGRIVRVRV